MLKNAVSLSEDCVNVYTARLQPYTEVPALALTDLGPVVRGPAYNCSQLV